MDKEMFQNLSKGQQVAAGGALSAVIAMFLPWYTQNVDFFGGFSIRGTSITTAWLGLMFLLAAAGLILAPAFNKSVDTKGIQTEHIAIVAAGVGGLFWLFRLVSTPFSVGRGFGLFVAAAAAAAIVAGVVMTMKEHNVAMPKVADFQTASATPAAPVQQYPAAVQQHPTPQQYPAPAPQQYPAPAPQQHAAPVAAPAPQQYPAPAPQQHAAPVAAPQHVAPQPAPPAAPQAPNQGPTTF